MGGRELLYDLPSYLIALGLFALMLAATQLGALVGRRAQDAGRSEVREHVNAVQASLLGVLALLLGFTFSLSLSRFDQRSAEVVSESNAIGTAYLRADLLDDGPRDEARRLIHQYATIRLDTAHVSAADVRARGEKVSEAEAVFARLWQLAADAARERRDPATVSFVASLNDMIDALASRDAAIDRHVPEMVIFLLFGTFVMLGGVVGYSSSLASVRPGVPIYTLMLLIVVLVFLIIDLDRPRRGLISVDQTKLEQTVRAMRPPTVPIPR